MSRRPSGHFNKAEKPTLGSALRGIVNRAVIWHTMCDQAKEAPRMDGQLPRSKKLNSFQIIILGFASAILLGAVLLALPVSSRNGTFTPPMDCLFTSTSAVCVTGLIVRDTATHWSQFGQAVLLLLIQVGGIGVVTAAASFALISGRKISLMQRSTMQEAMAAPKVGGIVRLALFILRTTFAIELLGAALLAPVFCRDFGLRGLWMALFHSVSAFCNAGFDLMGEAAPFSSLTRYAANPYLCAVILLLVVSGGLGFLTWDDVCTHKFRIRRYRMQSKVILSACAVLILVPAVLFFLFEFGSLPPGKRLLAALFQAVSPRTAGFNTVDLGRMGEPGQFVMIALMLVGGSPGSTAGGMKVTTIAVLFAAAVATFSRREHARFFGRRIGDETVKQAAAIFLMYIVLFWGGGLAISALEGLPMTACLFEAASAVGTVGLTLGVTPGLGTASRLILIALMFFGRVGGLTLIYAALSGKRHSPATLPLERITVG